MKIAIDIGGTYIKSGVIDEAQKLHGYQKVKTPENIQNEILNEVKSIIEMYVNDFELNNPKVGISTAGVVDSEKGVITYAGPTIPGYNGTNFKESLAYITHNVEIHNDVSCALLGELSEHDGNTQSLFLMTIGTGIGGAYYEDKLLEGANYKACEIGYLLYDEETNTTYEDRASTNALKSIINKQYREPVSVEQLFELAYSDDEKAMTILKNWAKKVAEGIAQVQIVFDPEIILIGGGISKQEEKLIDLIEPYINQYLPEDYGHARIETTSKGNDSALYGAVALFN
ncbi:ROK family protein [Mammaliicoccus lentus]|uniref:ROK family protein n=1 Tax=Mammaliicoccus lentus TaxID=42858 RepID=UPI001E292DA9|nr:ROK family protein [Mammaliicoccus lentus]MCD2476692.1 ROK family protein [Mammaliicoccus lentus]MCD2519803.1 ROK family protein [Mammaliicoccus lentus]